MEIRPIESPADYRAAVAEIDRLMDLAAELVARAAPAIGSKNVVRITCRGPLTVTNSNLVSSGTA